MVEYECILFLALLTIIGLCLNMAYCWGYDDGFYKGVKKGSEDKNNNAKTSKES